MTVQSKIWMLIDYPHAQHAVIEAAKGSLEFFWWYSNSPLEQAIEASPLWVQVPNMEHSLLTQFPSAPLFTTLAEDNKFKQHIMSLLIVRASNNKPHFLRFYEPQYLSGWLSSLDSVRLSDFLGPITSISWLENNKEQHLRNPVQISEYVQRDFAWFQLTDEDWAQLKLAFSQSR